MKFLDVQKQTYGYNAIQFVSKHGLMVGDADGKFYPDAQVSWADMCQTISTFLENGLIPSKCPYVDIGKWKDHWAGQYIAYCISKDVLSPEAPYQINFEDPIRANEAYSLFERTKKQNKMQILPEPRKQNVLGYTTRVDVAQLIYRTCDLTGRNIAESVFRLNKRNRWSQSLKLLFTYALCVEFIDSDIAMIFKLIQENPNRNESEDILCYEHMAKILKRKSLFRKKKTSEELFHYTNMTALEHLTREKAKFRLSNVTYLNDPMEGQLFMQRMKECFKNANFQGWEFLERDRDEFLISNSFVVSFTYENMEQLPMWVQYGDHAEGCRIGVRASSIKVPLYSIVYDTNTVTHFLDTVKNVLESYLGKKEDIDMNQDIVFAYAAKVLTQVSYLHKDKHYEHEREVRILLFSDPESAKSESRIRPGEYFPRLYIELEDEVEISSITLGPRATGIEKTAVALAGRKFDVRTVKKSEIYYR